MSNKDFCDWLTKDIGFKENENLLVFDKILDIEDKIKSFLNKNNLYLKCDDKTFLLKLCIILYSHSN